MNSTTLLTRTQVAATLHAMELSVPDDATPGQCRDICAVMGIVPDELCDDRSKAWSTIKVLQALKNGKATLSFRKDASSEIVSMAMDSASRQL